MWDESQTASLPFHQSVEQAENGGCGQRLYLNDRFNLVLACSEKTLRTYQWDLSPSVAGSKDHTQYTVVQIEEKYNIIHNCVLNLTLQDT